MHFAAIKQHAASLFDCFLIGSTFQCSSTTTLSLLLCLILQGKDATLSKILLSSGFIGGNTPL